MGKSSSSSTASVRSSLSKSSKKEKSKDKKKKKSSKTSSSKSVGDPPSSSSKITITTLPKEHSREKHSGDPSPATTTSKPDLSRTSTAEEPVPVEDSPPSSPASILKTKKSRDLPSSLQQENLISHRKSPAGAAVNVDVTTSSNRPSQRISPVAVPTATPTPVSWPVPEHVSFNESSIIRESSHSTSGGSIRVSFSNEIVSVSSTTYDDATYSENNSDDEEEEDEEPALPTLVTQTLWSHDPKLVRGALRELIRLLTEEEGVEDDDLDPRHEALLLGGHLTLIRVLQTHLQQPSDVAIQTLQALLLMFENVNVYWLGVLGSMGAIEAVVSTMMVKPQDLTLQEQAYRMLLTLLSVKGNAVKFLQLDGLAAMFRRLESFPEDRETNLDVCHVLKKLCEWEDTRTMLVSSGAVSTLAGVIDRCSGNDGTSVTSATTLTTDSPSVDGTGTVVSSASTIANDPAVQSSAYETMVALVAPEQQRRAHHRHDKRSSAGSVGKKSSKLKRHHHSSSKSSSSGRRKHHSCETVLEEELQQEREEEVEPETPPPPYQEYSTMIVRDLWSDCDEVVLTALSEIASTLDKSKHTYGKAFIEVGGPLAVTKVMEARRSPEVQQAGCEILHTLVSLEGFPTILGEVGGVETLLERLRDGTSVKLRKSAVKALAKMLKGSNSNNQRFFAAGGVPVLVRAMELHESSASFQEEACKVLKLCCSAETTYAKCKSAVMKSGGATAIARVFERHQNDPKAFKAAKKAMKALID